MKKGFFNLLVFFLLFILLLNSVFAIESKFEFSLKGILDGINTVMRPLQQALQNPAVVLIVMIATLYYILYYFLNMALAKIPLFSGSGGAGTGTYGKMIAHAISALAMVAMIFFSPTKNLNVFVQERLGPAGLFFGIVITAFIFILIWKSSNHNTKKALIGTALATFFISLLLDSPAMTLIAIVMFMIGVFLFIKGFVSGVSKGSYRRASRTQHRLGDFLRESYGAEGAAAHEDAQSDYLDHQDMESDHTQSQLFDSQEDLFSPLLDDAGQREEAIHNIAENPEMMANMIGQRLSFNQDQIADLQGKLSQMDPHHRKQLLTEIESLNPNLGGPVIREFESLPPDRGEDFVDSVADIREEDVNRFMRELSSLSQEDQRMFTQKMRSLKPRERERVIEDLFRMDPRMMPQVIRSAEPLPRALETMRAPVGV